jgi:hypothetical protein
MRGLYRRAICWFMQKLDRVLLTSARGLPTLLHILDCVAIPDFI